MQAQRKSKRCVILLPPGKRIRKHLVLLGLALLRISSSAASTGDPAAPSLELKDATLPSGFKVERYAQIWQRNPFTLVTPTVAKVQDSRFSKMFMTSWLKDGPQEVIYVQNADTNDVQRITEEPNQNNLRLLEFHSNSDPKLVEAVLSDGEEKGVVKFRFDGPGAAAQGFSPEVRAHSGALPANNPSRPGSQIPSQSVSTSAGPRGSSNGGPQVQGAPGQPSAVQGTLGSSSTGRNQMSPRGRLGRAVETEGVRLPAP
jgi:hypothetical protein